VTSKVRSGGRVNAFHAVAKARESYIPPPATPTPEPTQSPPDRNIGSPATTPSRGNSISLKRLRLPRRIALIGSVSDATQAPLQNKEVSLICARRRLASTHTNSGGGFHFFVKPTGSSTLCWASDGTGARSRKLRLR
jgi:hypothetical protein